MEKLVFALFFLSQGLGAPKICLTLGALRKSTTSHPPALLLGSSFKALLMEVNGMSSETARDVE